MTVKIKPVFKNMGQARMQIIRQGIPVWLEPGDCIVGERYRVYAKMGLVEVGRDGLPKKPKPKAVAPAVNDPAPEKAPIKVRKIEIVDALMPRDEIKFGAPKTEPKPELQGETLKSMILADLEAADPELAINIVEEEDLIILLDDEDEEEDPTPFKCDECDRGFASKRGLKSHSRVHKK